MCSRESSCELFSKWSGVRRRRTCGTKEEGYATNSLYSCTERSRISAKANEEFWLLGEVQRLEKHCVMCAHSARASFSRHSAPCDSALFVAHTSRHAAQFCASVCLARASSVTSLNLSCCTRFSCVVVHSWRLGSATDWPRTAAGSCLTDRLHIDAPGVWGAWRDTGESPFLRSQFVHVAPL
jgi:hypothetical protein